MVEDLCMERRKSRRKRLFKQLWSSWKEPRWETWSTKAKENQNARDSYMAKGGNQALGRFTKYAHGYALGHAGPTLTQGQYVNVQPPNGHVRQLGGRGRGW